MNINDLSSTEQSALLRMLEYWRAHWDWECPTLFGLEKNQYEAVVNTWPQSLVEQEATTALALVGALREFLHGASAVRKEQVQKLAGLSYAEATGLLEKLLPRIDRALG